MSYLIHPTTWQADKTSLATIREQVFMHEQQVSAADEWDDKDENAVHFLVKDTQGNAIACARILLEQNLLHIGRVAVLKRYREQGVGHKLMQTMLAWCAEHNPTLDIYLHAQTTRIAFYARLGFSTSGEIFLDAGIPHIAMWLQQQDRLI